MSFNEQLPRWDNSGNEPPESKKNDGWLPEEKPPAQWFNWLFNRIYKVLLEIREKILGIEEDIENIEVPVESVNDKKGNVVLEAKDIKLEGEVTVEEGIEEALSRADEAFQSGVDRKQQAIVNINSMGGAVDDSMQFSEVLDGILDIETDPSIGTTDAVAADILAPKKVVSQGKLLTGTMANRGAINQSLTTNNQEYTIPAGFHNGLGKIKAVITGLVASVIKAGTTVGGVLGTFTNDATATAAQMLSGTIAYVKGNKVTGTMPNNSVIQQTITTQGGQINLPSGYVPPSSYVKAQFANLTPQNIKSGVNIGGVVGSLVQDIDISKAQITSTSYGVYTGSTYATVTTEWNSNARYAIITGFSLAIGSTRHINEPTSVICIRNGANNSNSGKLTVHTNNMDTLEATFSAGGARDAGIMVCQF